jgi:hypothetical protein
MSGGGGLDVGKELAQLDKDLSLSENAPMIASAAATYMGVPLSPVEMGAILGAGRAIDKGSVSEGINWGLQGYGGGSLGAAMAPGAVPTPTGGAPIPVETATPMPVAVGPETGGTWFSGTGAYGGTTAGDAALASGNAGAGAGAAGVDAIGPGINEPYVGQQATMAPNMAAPAAQSGTGIFDKATAAYSGLNPIVKYGIPLAAASMLADRKGAPPGQTPYDGPLNKLKYDPDRYRPLEVKPPVPYTPVYKDYRNMFGGGLTSIGEQIKRLAQEHEQSKYATPPLSYDPARYDAEAGTKMVARPGMARGGIADLGGYSDGGRMLKGPGDGMSDSIPATISNKQPARLADGEFVVPADVVSHLGNGSTDAGAKQLYKMMDKVRVARTGKKMQGRQINPRKYVPA